MSDHTMVLTVVLDRAMRIEDDAQHIMNAIRMIKGVVSVDANVTNFEQYAAIETARRDISDKLIEVLYPKKT